MKLGPERLKGEAELLVICFIRDTMVIKNEMTKLSKLLIILSITI